MKSPAWAIAALTIRGTAPYMQRPFSSPDDRDLPCYVHSAENESWAGIPTNSIRGALMSACRDLGLKLTACKLSLFVSHDGFDEADGSPLVRITKQIPAPATLQLRMLGRVTSAACTRWEAGWEALVRIRYDKEVFTARDVNNLLMRAGILSGIGAGRPGLHMGASAFGTFEVAEA